MITSPAAASAPRTRLRRYAPVGVVAVAVVIVVALAAWLLVPSPGFPSERLAGWRLNYGYLGPGFDPATAQTRRP